MAMNTSCNPYLAKQVDRLGPSGHATSSGYGASSIGTLECSYCHGDPKDHHLHPNNSAKKKPFGKGFPKSTYKGSRANSAIPVPDHVPAALSTVPSVSPDKPTIHGQIDNLQAQISQLLQCFSQGKSTPEEHLAGPTSR